MSESEGRSPGIEFPKFESLEASVQRALRQLEVWRQRAVASESQRRALQEELDRSKSKSASPEEVDMELERLRSENAALRRRVEEGRQQAERLAREVDLLEDA